MSFYFHRLVAVLSVLALCACGATSSPTSGEYTPSDAKAIAQPSATPNLALSISAEATNSTKTSQSPSLSSLDILTVSLHCTTYIETRWGTEPGEFGLCSDSSLTSTRGPYPPVLNAQGDLFILDKANQRILRYSGNSTPQVIPIPSSYVLDDVCGYSNRGWTNLSVSKNRLFLRFSVRQDRLVDRLAVLSLEGQDDRIIDLEAYYPLHSPFANSLIADRKGGVYLLLPPAGVVHFDADLRPEFIYLGTDDLLIYQGLVVGWDGNLYTYSAERDHLDSWGADNRFFILGEPLGSVTDVIAATQIVSPAFRRFLGADVQGRLYFGVLERGTDLRFVRISALGGQRVVAAVPEGLGLPSSFSLAPDGSLYGATYNHKNPDPLLEPRIVRCVFDQDPILTPTP